MFSRSALVRTPRHVIVIMIALLALAAVGVRRLGHRSGRGGRPLDHDRRGVPGDHRTPVRHHDDPRSPERVLTIGFNEQDYALAFGVEPVGVREFLGYDAPTGRGRPRPCAARRSRPSEPGPGVREDRRPGPRPDPGHQLLHRRGGLRQARGHRADGRPVRRRRRRRHHLGGADPGTGKALGQDAEAKELVDADQAAFAAAGRRTRPSPASAPPSRSGRRRPASAAWAPTTTAPAG